MQVDAHELRRHFALLSDDALLAVCPEDLTDQACKLHAEELARRGLQPEQPQPEAAETADVELEVDTGPPGWIDDAACACSFATYAGSSYAQKAARACSALRAAGIPCYLELVDGEPWSMERRSRPIAQVMVPGALLMHATSILDRDLLNQEVETNWRNHLKGLSADNLHALVPEIFCAGLLDRVERLRRAYEAEVAARRQAADAAEAS
jgi:hypothetical protein